MAKADTEASEERPTVLDTPAGQMRIEGFTILELLGKGGMGIVYRARDETLKRKVAIKVFAEEVFASPDAVARFAAEARAAAAVDHPAVVRILKSGSWRNRPYLIHELVRGKNFEEFLSREKPGPAHVLAILAPLARGLPAVHDAGFLHRDVKPSNILLDRDRDGAARLADLGIARPLEGSHLTRTGEVLGTPAYMSPEQARGERVGPATEIYSLGAVLYRALTGRPPFEKKGGLASTLFLVGTAQPVPVRQIDRSISPEAAAICERAMEFEPARR